MPKSPTPKIKASRRAEIGLERRSRTRERLVQAALAVVAEQGFDLPVIDDFIVAAKVSRGTFYNYFRTKDELVQALCERINAERMKHHDHIRAEVEDLAERLVVGVRLNLRRAQEQPEWGRVYAQERVRRMGGRTTESRGPKRDLLNAIEAGRLPTQPIDLALDMFYGVLHQAMARAISGRGPEDLDQHAATFILAGLGMPYDEAAAIAARPLPPDTPTGQAAPVKSPPSRRRRPLLAN